MRTTPRATVRAESGVMIGENCVLGSLKEARLRGKDADLESCARDAPEVFIGEDCLIFNQVVIYEGGQLGRRCVVEDRVRIGYDARIGRDVRLLYGAYLCDRVQIGDDARVSGFVCDGAAIGARSTMMGRMVHEYSRPHRGWWEVDEPAPIIREETVVGFDALIVGGVILGPRSYVAAGAVVTRDVPPGYVVTGTNKLTLGMDWPGGRLRDLIMHWSRHSSK